MAVIQNKIDEILKRKNLSRYELNKQINYYESDLNKMIKGKKTFPDHIIEKLLPILDISKEEFTSWIAVDKYSKEALQIAIDELKNKSNDNTSAITKNIDKRLLKKTLSRTELSRLIKYDQSGLNKMIAGQISMSKTVISRLAPVLEVNEEIIHGWILADKYPLEVLQKTLSNNGYF